MIRMDMFPWRKAVQECKPILVFFKEDCTIDEIVFSLVPLNPLATISRCAVLVAGLAQYLRSASTQFQL